MRIAPFALLLMLSIAAAAEDISPTIKGHRVGESFTEYMVTAKGTPEAAASALRGCGNLLADRKEQRKRRNDVDGCTQMAKANDGETAVIQEGLSRFMFVSKKLVMINLTILEDFAKVEQDLINKYGPPDKEELVRYQNGFGAVFSHPRATWLSRSDVVVVATEEAKPVLEGIPNVPLIYTIAVQIADQAWSKSLVDKDRSRPSSVD